MRGNFIIYKVPCISFTNMAIKSCLFCNILGGLIFPFIVWTYENVALNKIAWQKHPNIKDDLNASLAVDGRKSDLSKWKRECVSSEDDSTAEWRVDLSSVLSIHHIVIHYVQNNVVRDESDDQTAYFLGFSLYISNTTSKMDGVLCFKDKNYTRATIPNPVNITCPYHGRYVIYYNNRTYHPSPDGYSYYAHNDLCEVDVFGCSSAGFYGENCSKPCHKNCQEGHCHITEGTCLGCQAGYRGPMCNEECMQFTYGLECKQTCGRCSEGEQCNHMNGSCLNGCDVGVYGEKCDRECPDGRYGRNCQENCSKHCIMSERCDNVMGQCVGGCQSGWKNIQCDKECDGGMFGNHCNKTCGKCFNNEQCHHINGGCLNGCSPGYQGINCTEVKNNRAVIAGISITTSVVIAVVVLFFALRSFRSTPQNIETERQGDTPDVTNDYQEDASTIDTNSVHSHEHETKPMLECKTVSIKRKSEEPENSGACFSKEHVANDNQFEKCGVTSSDGLCSKNAPDMTVNQLHKIIADMKKCTDEGFKTEYSMLSTGEIFPSSVGKQEENLTKNRYKTMLPYDHSRVIVSGDNECSEYINASFIEDTNEEFGYIATQGPKENTVNDFWRMVWQQNVTHIVMLTNLMENGKIKCSKYWPDCLTIELFGNVTIENVSEKHYASYITRKFVLSHKQMSRDIMQYHYTMWPDHDTPEPLSLALFHSQVIRTISDENRKPLVVHCSAGIGRTGTFIALDALYKEGKRTGKINVAKYVKIMRSCRMNMVQTYEQYLTIFIALNERFKASLQRKRISTFEERLDRVLSSQQNQTCIKGEFEKLLYIRPEYTSDDYLESSQHVNKTHSALPLDKYMLYLPSSIANRGSYINAIAVSSYVQNNAFIVTHYQPPEDAVDFLRLLIDHESNIVISMGPLSEIKSSNSLLLGSSSEKMVDPFSVQRVGVTETDVKITNIRILKEEDFSYDVSIVEPRDIPELDDIPMDASSLRSLVSYTMNVSTEGPITIVSKDGALLCGAFCAVFNCIQQINMDDSVDVFTTVRQLQTRRPEFCSTLDKYMLVHRALHDYIGRMSKKIYENL